jgi:hypothetical protein
MQHEMAGRRAIDTILMKTEKPYESSFLQATFIAFLCASSNKAHS